MARSIRTNNKDRWELYSSIAEGAIGTFKTERELIAFIAEENVYKGKIEAIREMMSFPHGWHVNGVYTASLEKDRPFRQWYDELLNTPEDEEFAFIDKKYNELMDKIKPMYKIFDYDKGDPWGDNGRDSWEPHVIFETPLDLDICLLIEIKGETYATCMKSPKQKIIGVHKRPIEAKPEKQHGMYFTCPYCKKTDHDAWEFSIDEDEHECGYCYSDLKYVRHAEELEDGDWYIEYTVYPVKQKEIIKID